MKKTLILILACGYAFGQNNSSDSNLYLGVGAGAAWNKIATPAAALRADIGYNLNNFWAIELGTLGIAQSQSSPKQSMEYYDISVKGKVPLGVEYGTLFVAQLGGAYGSPGVIGVNDNASIDPSYSLAGWNALAGVGFEQKVSDKVTLNLMDYYYFPATNPQGNTNVVLGGVQFDF